MTDNSIDAIRKTLLNYFIKRRGYGSYSRFYDKTEKEIIIDALQKQIPSNPIGRYDYHGARIIGAIPRCPKCKGKMDRKQHYCDLCGQALDWSDADE